MNRIVKTFVIFTSFYCFSVPLNAQTDQNHQLNISSGIGVGHGKNLPFWLLSNRYGMTVNDPVQAYGKIGYKKAVDEDSKFSFGYGISVLGRLNKDTDIYAEEWYGKLKFHFLELEAGARRRILGVQEGDIGSGGLLWSGNARPLPLVTLSTADYVEVPFTEDFLRVNSGISHGWMDDFPGIRDVWLHHKWLMFKGGGSSPFQVTAGLHHFAQWGGYSDVYGQLPTNLNTFRKVLIANGGNEDSPNPEQINAAGNHLGSYNLRFDIKTAESLLGIYWESVFEDNSGRKMRNFPDGLYGLAFRNKNKDAFFKAFVLEYLQTDYQSGAVKIDTINNVPYTGGDNYFSHYIYKMGWSSHLMTIGTPLITSPVYSVSENGHYFFKNNRVKALHLGFEGRIKFLDYRFLYTYTLNKGRYASALDPHSVDQMLLFSVSIEDHLLKGSVFKLDVGIDRGDFYGNNTGFLLVWEKKILLPSFK